MFGIPGFNPLNILKFIPVNKVTVRYN